MNNQSLAEFVKANPIGVLSTMSTDGIASAAVYYVVDTDGTLYFNAHRGSEKIKNIAMDPRVSFVVFQQNPAVTLQAKGRAEVIEDISHIEETYTALLHRIFQNGAVPPILKTGGDQMDLIKIVPTWMRLADYSPEKKGEGMFTMIVG